MKAWKVVSILENGKLSSVWAKGKARKIYRYGVKNYPPQWLAMYGYGLICFRTKKQAVMFIRYDFVLSKIMRVEVGNPIPCKPHIPFDCLCAGKVESNRNDPNVWPDGTIMVPWVKLIGG